MSRAFGPTTTSAILASASPALGSVGTSGAGKRTLSAVTSSSSEPFEYHPTPGVHSRWGLVVDDGNGQGFVEYPFGLFTLSDVESAVEETIDEACEADSASIKRVLGAHGWRMFELSNGTTLQCRWEHFTIDYRCGKGCGYDTSNEGYMVTDEVWSSAGLQHDDGWVCVGCLEAALGRELTAVDFVDLPMNTDLQSDRSERLRNRLGDLLSPKSKDSPKVTLDAPIASIDLEAFDDDGASYEITPCHECLPWRAEVVLDVEDNRPIVREWHAAECPSLVELLENSDQ